MTAPEPLDPPHIPTEPALRVLLVDDSPRVRQDLRQLLELAGGMEIVAEAGSGQEAVWLAETCAADVVVMDLDMPIMDGFEATRQIKERQPACRVVILSIHAGPEERERARAAGADDFIVKGASYEILVNAIRGTKSSSNPSEPKKGKTS